MYTIGSSATNYVLTQLFIILSSYQTFYQSIKATYQTIISKCFDWAIGLNRLTLNFMGLWPGENSQRSLIVPAMIACIFFGLTAPVSYALVKVRGHLPLVVDNLNANLIAVVGTVKLFLLWRGRRVIDSLVSQVWDDWFAARISINETMTMQVHASRARLLTIIGCCTTIGCLIVFSTMPVLQLSIRSLNNITDLHSSRYMPFQSFYPYDVYKSPAYELSYFQQLIAGCLIALSFSVPENFFAALVLHACAQCQILENRFQHLVNYSGAADGLYFSVHLRQTVNRHNRLIRFVDDIEILFNHLILAHMLFLTVVIGCLGFTLLEAFSNNNDSSPLLRVTTFLATTMDLLMYTLIYCGAGEFLVSNSFRLHGAVYQTNLQLLPSNCARNFLIVMMRSQKPLQLTAGKFFKLTLNTYLQLVKNAAGYISMLITVNQR